MSKLIRRMQAISRAVPARARAKSMLAQAMMNVAKARKDESLYLIHTTSCANT